MFHILKQKIKLENKEHLSFDKKQCRTWWYKHTKKKKNNLTFYLFKKWSFAIKTFGLIHFFYVLKNLIKTCMS